MSDEKGLEPAPEPAGSADEPEIEIVSFGDDPEPSSAPGGLSDEAAGKLRRELAEEKDRYLRLRADFDNYRKRVERDREVMRDVAVGSSLAELLPVLDDIGRARDHGDLEGAFKSVAEALEATVARQGLERFGVAGDEFDPTVHEAITHAHSADVAVTTCVSVFQPGYRYKGKTLRPAIVAVADPE